MNSVIHKGNRCALLLNWQEITQETYSKASTEGLPLFVFLGWGVTHTCTYKALFQVHTAVQVLLRSGYQQLQFDTSLLYFMFFPCLAKSLHWRNDNSEQNSWRSSASLLYLTNSLQLRWYQQATTEIATNTAHRYSHFSNRSTLLQWIQPVV